MEPHRFSPPAEGSAIRELGPDELSLFREHLLRLDAASRRDRFNGGTDDVFVVAYAARCFGDGTTVIAHVEDGAVRGAAELHECLPGRRDVAEIAFSVEEGWQRRGLGSRLFEHLIARARALGYAELRVTTHPQNEAMKALARRFGARLTFQNLETVGRIVLGDAGSQVKDSDVAAEPVAAPAETIARGDQPDSASPGRGDPEIAAYPFWGLIAALAGLRRTAFGPGRDSSSGR